MSRIGRLPIAIPSGVDVTVEGSQVTVKGPKGSLTHTVVEPISVERQDDGTLAVTRPDDERDSRSRHGLTRTLIANMVVGVTQGYEKGLEIVGTGYRVQAKGQDLEFALGYSHPARRHHLRGGGADEVLGVGHRQAEGRTDLGGHPPPASPGPVQGQGRSLRRRADPSQGRKDR